MKIILIIILFLAFFCTASSLVAEEPQNFSISESQAADVKQRLDAYESGKINIHALNENATTEENRQLVGYYLLHTNDISAKAKLPVARSYDAFGMELEASKLAVEYLNIYSNDFNAWNLLGGEYLYLKRPNDAIAAYTNAARLGYTEDYIYLAAAALQAGRWDVIKGVIPQLKSLKESESLPEPNKLDLVGVLLAYSIQTEDDRLFLDTLNGISSEQVSSRDDLKRFIAMGCQMFPDKEINQIRQKFALVETNSVDPSHQ